MSVLQQSHKQMHGIAWPSQVNKGPLWAATVLARSVRVVCSVWADTVCLSAFSPPVRHGTGSTGAYEHRTPSALDDIFPPAISASGFTCRWAGHETRHKRHGVFLLLMDAQTCSLHNIYLCYAYGG